MANWTHIYLLPSETHNNEVIFIALCYKDTENKEIDNSGILKFTKQMDYKDHKHIFLFVRGENKEAA